VIVLAMVNVVAENAFASVTSLEWTAAFMFAMLSACTALVRTEHANANLVGQELNAKPRFVHLSVLFTECAKTTQRVLVWRDGKDQLAPPRNVLTVLTVFATRVFAFALMDSEDLRAQSGCADLPIVTETVSALLVVAFASLASMDETAHWLNAKSVLEIIVIASMALALVTMVGPARTVKSLSARTIALDTEFVMMALVSVIWDGLDQIVLERSVPDNPIKTLAVVMEFATM
jgi:hypothetical protein